MVSERRSKSALWVGVFALLAVSCGGGDGVGTTDDVSTGRDGDVSADAGRGDESDGNAPASLTVGGDRWEFSSLACIAGPASLDFVASQGLAGVSTEPTAVVKVVGDWGGTGNGEIQIVDIGMFEGQLTDPDTAWSSTLDVGGASFEVDGNRFVGTGLFDDRLTPGTTEEVEGTFVAECDDPIVAPPQTTTTLPDFNESGSVTVDGETFVFTYDPPGRCGADAGDGKVSATGVLVDDPSRQVVFTYATAEMSTDGDPALQLIIYGPDGQQQWYSAVGYFGDGVGSVETMTGDATSVTVTGTLQRSGTEELVPFTAEATCDR